MTFGMLVLALAHGDELLNAGAWLWVHAQVIVWIVAVTGFAVSTGHMGSAWSSAQPISVMLLS